MYRRAPPKVDVNIRMVEMAVHGHKVADDAIIGTAVRRRPPRWTDKIEMLAFLVKVSAIFLPVFLGQRQNPHWIAHNNVDQRIGTASV